VVEARARPLSGRWVICAISCPNCPRAVVLVLLFKMPRTGLLVFGGLASVIACAALGLSRQPRAAGKEARAAAPQASVTATPATPGPCPADMTLAGSVCMDRYEAHLLVRGTDGALVPHPPYTSPSSGWFVAAAAAGVKPQAYVNQLQAASACEHAGKRLCSVGEWYRACTGEAGTTYPYGEHYQAGRCNVGKPHLLSLLHGSNPQGWRYSDFNDPALSARSGFLALTGEYADCAGPNGVHDLVGNLHEWVADRVDATLPSKLPLPAVVARRIGRRSGNGIFMGGFYSTRNEHGAGCKFVTAAHEPRYHDYSTGFRCCQDAR
jgi:formylglycine-generating enzyme